MTPGEITQTALTERMTRLGVVRSRSQHQRMVNLRNFSSTPAGAQLRDVAYLALLEQIKYDWKHRKNKGIGAPSPSIKERCEVFRGKDTTPRVVAAIGVCALLDCLMLHMSYPRACGHIGKMLDEELQLLAFRRKYPTYWDEVEREKKRRGVSKAREKAIQIAGKFVDTDRSSQRERSKAGLYILSTIERVTDMVTSYKVFKPNGRALRYVIPTLKTEEWVKKAVELRESRNPYYLPTVAVPMDWEDPLIGGYSGLDVVPRPLVRSHSKEYIRTLQHSDMDRVYSAVNKLQRVPWKVNQRVLEIAELMYKNGVILAGCHSGERLRAVNKWDSVDTDVEQRRIYRRLMAQTWEVNRIAKGKRLGWGRTITSARIYGNSSFYYPHHLDFRGRVYPTASVMTPQGDDLSISLLSFEESQVLSTDRDWFWVRVHGANLFGVDKVPFDERIAWVSKHEKQILKSAQDPLEHRWWADASKPMTFLSWCFEYQSALASKKHLWSLPVTIDGSNNGLQVYSFLLRDPVGGAATNCVPGPRPCDIYQDVADVVTRKLKEKAAGGDNSAARWLAVVGGRLPRAATKRIVMTTPYGASRFACLKYTAEWFGELSIASGTKEFAADLYKNLEYLSRIIWESIDDVVVSARRGMKWFRECADIFSEVGKDIRWTAPSGFEILQKYKKQSGSKGVSLTFGRRIETVAYRDQTPVVDPQRQRNGLAPNVIHSLDAAVLVDVVNRAPASSFRAVHDSYGSLPKDMDAIGCAVRSSYSDIFQDDWLANLHAQWQSQMPEDVILPTPPKRGLMSVEAVKRSPYFFA